LAFFAAIFIMKARIDAALTGLTVSPRIPPTDAARRFERCARLRA